MLFAQLSYAFYFVLYKNFVNRYSMITIMKWMFTFGSICILPFTWHNLSATEWSLLSGKEIGSLVFIVVGSTFLSYMLIIVGQKTCGRPSPECTTTSNRSSLHSSPYAGAWSPSTSPRSAPYCSSSAVSTW